MAPSTFASAAAGNLTRDAAADWSRRTNGATQTFRRPSGAAATASAAQPSDSPASSHPPRYVPPHRNGTVNDLRYTKEQMLDIFKAQQSVHGGLSDGLQDLFVAGWQSDTTNGTSAAWSRSDHNREPQHLADVCWDRDGGIEPLGLQEMDDEEREIFMTSVNTPIKPPATNKENHQVNGLPGRKTSISHSATTPGAFGLPSPNFARGSARRRETGESYPFPQSNIASPGSLSRDDQRTASPPPSLLRRKTDLKDLNKSDDRESEDKSASTPFGSLKRNPTGPLSAGLTGPSSPWATAPQSAGLSPMGSFGNFGMGASSAQQGTANDKRAGLGGGRPESRFKNLLSKDSNDELAQKGLERKGSVPGRSRVNENESWRSRDRSDQANATLDEAEEMLPSGSAALAADTDTSPPQPRHGLRGFGTPSRQGTHDEFGFGAFGMTSDHPHSFGQGVHPSRDAFHQTPAQQRLGGTNEPMSPTDTNPYQSPEHHNGERASEDMGDDGDDLHSAHLPGLGQFGIDQAQQLGGLGGLGPVPSFNRGPGGQGPASDRSQNSSVSANRGFSGLGGLGMPGSAAWPVSQSGLNNPARQTAGLSNPFGGGMFSNAMPDLHASNLAGLGGANFLGHQGGPYGGSRMASMFPPAMQEQMRQTDPERDMSSERAGQGFPNLGEIGRAVESPFANQGLNQAQESKGLTDTGDSQQAPFSVPGQQQQEHNQSQAQAQMSAISASNQPPAAQQRTMVMPDRMRWIYRDPQGQTQGPWTGLEMHDWYKAGFFSPELLVKKAEDTDYEPLAQLIRRIGNSREPFLVPQIGIPHGAPSSSSGPSAWTGTGPVATGGAAQPPFASSFPSFGTTLTAEQQNALERRKQEEQYLMARQKEHLAQAQIAQRMHVQSGHPGLGAAQLHHHSSAHSLQSQPSFGSITSPTAYQPSPIQGPTGGMASAPSFFDNSFRGGQQGGMAPVGTGVDSLGRIREEDVPGMERLSISGTRAGFGQFGAPGQPFGVQQQQAQQAGDNAHNEQVQQMLEDRAMLQQEQAQHDAQQAAADNDLQPMPNDRLQQFQHLQHEATGMEQSPHKIDEPAVPQHSAAVKSRAKAVQSQLSQEPLSLTEQVQKAASAKHSPAPQQPGLPQPFPPAPSQSPLPAPSAQRTGRQSVADQLQTESRDRSQTPSLDTPSAAVAPWAKEPAEAPRGPSLKQIQEAEARKAAEAEELAVAARRAAFQKEMEAQAQAVAPQPGLPTSSTWAASPATPTGPGGVPWGAKTAQKPAGSITSKTLAQIQKEEEARKRKSQAAAILAQQQANALAGVAAAPALGKSYANLAGKVASPAPNANVGGAWTTVGAGGKAKTPGGGPMPAAPRSTSSSVVPTLQTPVAAPRKQPAKSTTATSAGAVNAQEEFKKWVLGEMRLHLDQGFTGLTPEDFVATLTHLPTELEIITEAVHGSSRTIDSRHFAEEFIRKKRLADKGLIDSSMSKSGSPGHAADKNAGGWSQVAKKGPLKEEPKEEANGNFRMVPSKKKGGKK